MKRASYKEAIAWIALNDDAGGDEALDLEYTKGYVTTCLVADLFGVDTGKVGKDIVKYRKNNNALED